VDYSKLFIGTSKRDRRNRRNRPKYVKHSQVDVRLIEEKLNFKAKVDFKEGLKKTVEWYKGIL